MIGRRLGHYQVTDKLGEGGMGVVYRAHDTHLNRAVALRVLPPGTAADPERRRRFEQEAKAASALNHPNIITIYDIAAEVGIDYIAMEFVEGRTLDELSAGRPLPLPEALRYAGQIAGALAAAHAKGIIHRDLKPANVMVVEDGLLKVLDFGLAKLVEPETAGEDESTRTAGDRTKTGAIVGTVAYMSPEQAEGKKLDARSDIFSLGVILYELLTGRRPFQANSPASLMSAILRDEPVPPSQIVNTLPQEMERVVLRCLRKDPQRRYQTMSDLKVVLEDLKEESVSGTLAAVASVRRRRSRAWMVGAAALLAVVVAAALMLWQSRRLSAPAPYEVTRLTFEAGMAAFPAISRDGKMLVFASDRSGNLDLYVQQIKGRQASRLTDNAADDSEPSFSPDGTRIAFTSARDGGGVYVVDTLGGPERKLADRGRQPRYSPDASTIAYLVISSFSTTAKMFLIPAEGGAPRPFHPELTIRMAGAGWTPPMWAPDGKYLLLRAVRKDGKGGWWVAPVEGGEATAIEPPPSRPPVLQLPELWVGDFVYYAEGTDYGGGSIYRVPIMPDPWRVGLPQKLTSGTGVVFGMSMSDDGRLVFNWVTYLKSIWSVAVDSDTGAAKGAPELLPTDSAGQMGLAVAANGSKIAYSALMMMPERAELRIRDLASGREDSLPLTFSPASGAPRLSPDGSKVAYRNFIGGKAVYYLADTSGGGGTQICENCRIMGFFSMALIFWWLRASN